jgi:hypothetical protein
MKTAVLISGHMRSFDRCLPTLHLHVFRHFPDTDFFVSTVADDDAPKAQLLRTQYPQARVEIDCVPEQPDCIADLRAKGCQLPDVWQRGQPYMHEPYAISVHPQAVARQLWQLEQCWNLFTTATAGDAAHYDLVIRCRPDLWFQSFAFPEEISDVYKKWTDSFADSIALTPWWGRFGGVNDRFAMLGPRIAKHYFTAYSQIPKLLADGFPLHPESLVYGAVRAGGGLIRDHLRADFSTLRTTGELRAPEITAADIACASLSR